MNCRICNTPSAPCELADKKEDGKGLCLACLVKQRDEMVAMFAKLKGEIIAIEATSTLPDGDGVNVSTSLWFEEWARRLSIP
jgi:hypothetical protein